MMVVKYIGEDDWGRPMYLDKNLVCYQDVDGYLHTTTSWGEPIRPIMKMEDCIIFNKTK